MVATVTRVRVSSFEHSQLYDHTPAIRDDLPTVDGELNCNTLSCRHRSGQSNA
jgi:hypothetical protein